MNRWRMKSSLNDRVYIFLILTLCFGVPTLTIITSYAAIIIKVGEHSEIFEIIIHTDTNNIPWLKYVEGNSSVVTVCDDFRCIGLVAYWPQFLHPMSQTATKIFDWQRYQIQLNYPSRHSIFVSFLHHTVSEPFLLQIAAVVCSSFLIAWTPYAIISLYSALTAKEEHPGVEGGTPLSAGMSETGYGHVRKLSDVFGFPFLVNWTSPEHFGDAIGTWRNATPGQFQSLLGHGPKSTLGSVHGGMDKPRYVSSLSPEVTLIPTIFAKSHCIINPFIYQIMNRDFREDVYDLLFWRVKDGERRRARSTDGSVSEGEKLDYTICLKRF